MCSFASAGTSKTYIGAAVCVAVKTVWKKSGFASVQDIPAQPTDLLAGISFVSHFELKKRFPVLPVDDKCKMIFPYIVYPST